MPGGNPKSLHQALLDAPDIKARFFYGIKGSACLLDVRRGSPLRARLSALSGRSVVLATRDQLVTALALIELDGLVRRLTLCPPELGVEQLLAVAKVAQADGFVSDYPQPHPGIQNWVQISFEPERLEAIEYPANPHATE